MAGARPGRRGAADRHGQDVRRHPGHHRAGRPALVVTPTIDLLNQWYGELRRRFDVADRPAGRRLLRLPAAHRHDLRLGVHPPRKWGNRFGLLVFDECHHLPGPTTQVAAVGSIAPFRLGLTATPERADGLDAAIPT